MKHWQCLSMEPKCVENHFKIILQRCQCIFKHWQCIQWNRRAFGICIYRTNANSHEKSQQRSWIVISFSVWSITSETSKYTALSCNFYKFLFKRRCKLQELSGNFCTFWLQFWLSQHSMKSPWLKEPLFINWTCLHFVWHSILHATTDGFNPICIEYWISLNSIQPFNLMYKIIGIRSICNKFLL